MPPLIQSIAFTPGGGLTHSAGKFWISTSSTRFLAASYLLRLIAIDHEPAALHATDANARRNGVEVDALQGDLAELPPPPAPTLAANVPLKVHMNLAANLAPETRVVLISGIVDDHVGPVTKAYEAAGLRLVDTAVVRNWAAALLVRA